MVSPEVAAIALTLAVHIFGAAVLITAMFDSDEPLWKGWWPREQDDDDPPPAPPAPLAGPDGLPLPDAQQSRRRLRGPGRIGPGRRRGRTRPSREPARTPAEAPSPERHRDAS